MKKYICSLLALTFSTLIFSTAMAQEKKQSPGKVLRHVVLIKWQDTSSPEDIGRVEAAFRELPKKISQISDFEWGTNNSVENLNEGLTHGYLISFRDEKGRDAYLVHPDHLAFVEIAKPHIDKVTVVDYWAKK